MKKIDARENNYGAVILSGAETSRSEVPAQSKSLPCFAEAPSEAEGKPKGPLPSPQTHGPEQELIPVIVKVT